jgi:hypothetical protein
MLECCQGIFVPIHEHAGETQARYADTLRQAPDTAFNDVADIQVAGDLPDVGGTPR